MKKLGDEQEKIQTIFNTQAGRDLLDIWRIVYMDRPSYEPGRPVEECVYFEGQRSVILDILQKAETKA